MHRLAAEDSRIVYHWQENGGIVAALNAGLALCTAPYVARMDGDDLCFPERFAQQRDYLDRTPGCVAVSALAWHIDGSSRRTGTCSRFRRPEDANNCSLPATEPYLLHPMLMVRREAILAVGGYRPIVNAEDSDLYWRLAARGNLHILPYPLGEYRVHAQSVSSRSIRNGRSTALWSQLAALSDQRREGGAKDLPIGPAFVREVGAETELGAMLRVVAPHLSLDERAWLGSAVSAKLLELCYYRPFEPEVSDISFIRHAIRRDLIVRSRPGYAVFAGGMLSAGIRLLLAGDARLAFSIVPATRWPILIARAAFRGALSPRLRQRIRRAVGQT